MAVNKKNAAIKDGFYWFHHPSLRLVDKSIVGFLGDCAYIMGIGSIFEKEEFLSRKGLCLIEEITVPNNGIITASKTTLRTGGEKEISGTKEESSKEKTDLDKEFNGLVSKKEEPEEASKLKSRKGPTIKKEGGAEKRNDFGIPIGEEIPFDPFAD